MDKFLVLVALIIALMMLCAFFSVIMVIQWS